MDLKSFTQAIDQIADEKGIAKEKVIETIEMALAAAYKRDYGERGQIVRATLDPVTGKVNVRQIKIAVDETMIKSEEEIKAEEEEREKRLAEIEASGGKIPERPREEPEEVMSEGEEVPKKVRFNEEKHIMVEEARKIKPDANPGDELEFPLEYHEEFGRIAAQTAKQVIIQRIREAEREAVYDEFKTREGELVSGMVQRIEGRNLFVDIGRIAGVLPFEEQIPGERYHIGERLKAIITLVEKDSKGPNVFLSRSHPKLLKKLFELEVPEISSGAVEIKAVAREPGFRSKIAVVSHEQGVDPVGSMVGQKGVRVMTVIHEIAGEKIDIIEWSDDPAEFVGNAISPAKVKNVELNPSRREARAIVAENELSLAIGKEGQNVRLAAKLTGWKIDVRPDKSRQASEIEEDKGEAPAEKIEEKPESKISTEEKIEPKDEVKSEEGIAAAQEEKPKKKREKKVKKE
ncbi:MAG: transcription termination/antitermination protein NusA [Candidatus Sungbacteria bacterium]|nr:transcription termination/antitermination protein NusA [Candidatus Sungbacteria bacterium]